MCKCPSFDLGDDPASAMAQYPIELNQWHNVEIRRTGRQGTIRLEGEVVGEVSRAILDNCWCHTLVHLYTLEIVYRVTGYRVAL